MKKRTTLAEALQLIQELDYVPGVSMAVPDFNYELDPKHQIQLNPKGPFPYDGRAGGGPANSRGTTGQRGVGRGGVGWGGREDVSGQIREPSSTYSDTWDHTDEGADWDEAQRHGGDRRNLWRDTPDGKTLRKQVNQEEIPESMGSPMQIGPVAPMDGPQHNVLNFSGSVSDELPNDEMRSGVGNMWGGPGMVPGTSRGWANSPTRGSNPEDIWQVPKEGSMKLKELFDPKPIETEPLENQGQDYLNDATDDELEDRVHPDQDDEPTADIGDFFADDDDAHAGEVEGPEGEDDGGSFAGRYGGETIMMMPNIGRGVDFVMSPDRFGAARGTYGMHMDGKDRASPEMLDKRSAWDILQHVITAMAKSVSAPHEKPENEDNDGISG